VPAVLAVAVIHLVVAVVPALPVIVPEVGQAVQLAVPEEAVGVAETPPMPVVRRIPPLPALAVMALAVLAAQQEEIQEQVILAVVVIPARRLGRVALEAPETISMVPMALAAGVVDLGVKLRPEL
jgi:hypothetical protein